MISNIFKEIAIYLELKGENHFKVRAYENAARTIEALEENLVDLVSSGEITKLPGIGKTLAENITELVTSGDLKEYHQVKKGIPPALLEVIKIPGLGPKRVSRLYKDLGIESLTDLEYACLENRLQGIKGFGQKSQKNILEGIEQLKKYQGKYHYLDGMMQAEEIVKELEKSLADRKSVV